LNLRQVQRGDKLQKTVDFLPGKNRKSITVLGVKVEDGIPLGHEVEPLRTEKGEGARIRFTIPDTVALGTLTTVANVKLSIDGIERERVVPIRGEVVGDLTWTPKVVDSTRQPSLHGKKLSPVTVNSTRAAPFQIVRVDAGPLLTPTFESLKRETQPGYSVSLTVKNDAPAGPFAAALRIYTDLLDQPMIEIPVFGIVSTPLEIEPSLILLRADGTPMGAKRSVKLLADPSVELNISEARCEDAAVKTVIEQPVYGQARHVRRLTVEYSGPSPQAARETKLVLSTNVPGAERVEIPVVVEPGKR